MIWSVTMHSTSEPMSPQMNTDNDGDCSGRMLDEDEMVFCVQCLYIFA